MDDRLRVHSFAIIWIWISDPRSLGSWCIKGTDESVTRVDSSVILMRHDPSDPDPDHPKGTHPNCRKKLKLHFPILILFQAPVSTYVRFNLFVITAKSGDTFNVKIYKMLSFSLKCHLAISEYLLH